MMSTASLRWSSRLLNLLCLTIHIYNGTSILITKGLVKYVRDNGVSLYRGSFSRYFTIARAKVSFVMPRISL